MGCAKRVCVAAILIWAAATPFCAGRAEGVAKRYSAEELIAEIIASERRIHDVELHFDDILVGRGNHVYRSLDWGYEGGKMYLAGIVSTRSVPERNIPAHESKKISAWDGRKRHRLSEEFSFRDGRAFSAGWWGSIGPEIDDSFDHLFPTRLLGYDLVSKCSIDSVTLGGLLSTARRVSLRPKVEKIDGHLCTVVEAIGARYINRMSGASGTKYYDATMDVRVRIDTQRDFRPLRIETYYGDKGPLHVFGRIRRWQGPMQIIQDIKLEKINDVWFPVDGTLTFFKHEVVSSLDRMTAGQFRRLPLRKRRELSKYVFEPMPSKSRRVRVHRDTVRINSGIDPKKFTIEFPKGCKIVDNFRLAQYTVGEKGDPALYPHSSGSTILQRLADFKVPLVPEQVKGKRILICFWRMGDAKSAQILRRLRDRANDLADSGVVPALVHAEPAKLEKIERWLLMKQIPFLSGVVAHKYEADAWWKARSLPSFALTDTEHLIIATGFGPDELDEKLKKSGHAER